MDIHKPIKALNSYLEKARMTPELALFYVESYYKLSNKVFRSRMYKIKRTIQNLCQEDTQNLFQLSEVLSIMLVYYATQTSPKRFSLKNSKTKRDIIKYIAQFDIHTFSLEDFLEKIPNLRKEDSVPTWFSQTLYALKANSSELNVNPTAYLFIKYILDHLSDDNNLEQMQ